MQKTKIGGIVFMLGGTALLLLSLLADYIGVGDVDPDHFIIGTKQITGMVIGALAAGAGILLWWKK